MFTNFTPMEYLMIDCANAYGKDKDLFEDRIKFVKDNGKILESLTPDAEEPILYTKSVMAIRKALSKGTTNHMVELDAVNSGLQISSVLTGCLTGASYCGLVYPDVRSDAYSSLMHIMNTFLSEDMKITKNSATSRQHLKDALMTSFYGSFAKPIEIFGYGSAHLEAFYAAFKQMAPGCYYLLQLLLGLINVEQLVYEWTLPDGHTAHCKVIADVTKKIKTLEIPTATGKEGTFSHIYQVHCQDDTYRALPANVNHSVDSYGVRESKRRAMYSRKDMYTVYNAIQGCKVTDPTEIVSVVEVKNILAGKDDYSDNTMGKLAQVLETCMDTPEFPLVTIHDAFKTYAQYCNYSRRNYNEILAEIAESNMLQGMLQQITHTNNIFYKQKDHAQLPALIRNSNYAIC